MTAQRKNMKWTFKIKHQEIIVVLQCFQVSLLKQQVDELAQSQEDSSKIHDMYKYRYVKATRGAVVE